jgi:hypothetical protein
VIHASKVEPWSQPGISRKIFSWLGQEDAPLLLRYGAIAHMWRWRPEFIANCSEERFRNNARPNPGHSDDTERLQAGLHDDFHLGHDRAESL